MEKINHLMMNEKEIYILNNPGGSNIGSDLTVEITSMAAGVVNVSLPNANNVTYCLPVKTGILGAGKSKQIVGSFPAWVKYTAVPPSVGAVVGVNEDGYMTLGNTGFLVLGVDTGRALCYVRPFSDNPRGVSLLGFTESDTQAFFTKNSDWQSIPNLNLFTHLAYLATVQLTLESSNDPSGLVLRMQLNDEESGTGNIITSNVLWTSCIGYNFRSGFNTFAMPVFFFQTVNPDIVYNKFRWQYTLEFAGTTQFTYTFIVPDGFAAAINL